jgi:hypothetical protein
VKSDLLGHKVSLRKRIHRLRLKLATIMRGRISFGLRLPAAEPVQRELEGVR